MVSRIGSKRACPWCEGLSRGLRGRPVGAGRGRVVPVVQISYFRLGSKQPGARIRTQNYPPQQQWAHSRRFDSEVALIPGSDSNTYDCPSLVDPAEFEGTPDSSA